MVTVRMTAAAALLGSMALSARAADWPQWRGPNRTGLSEETGLMTDWPSDGPKLGWRIEGLGDGYSTPSIAGGKIYLLGTKGKEEQLICLNEKDGKLEWSVVIGTMAGGYPGPRSTPTIDGGFAYAVSSNGNLVCVDVKAKKTAWTKDFRKEFGGRSGGWAYTESPLIDGEFVLATPGGDTATIVKLKKKDGSVVWKAAVTGITSEREGKGKKDRGYGVAGYSSIVKGTLAGVSQYVQFLDGGVVGVSEKEGKLLWHYDAPANGTANCSTPILSGDTVFAASAYGNGGGRAKITKDGDKFKATQEYFVKKMQNHHGGMVLVKDHIYGTNGGSLVCLEFATGKVVWEERSVGKGSVTYADGKLYVRGEDDGIALVEADPTAYKEIAKFKQPNRSKQKAWPHPVVANGALYIRDWDSLLRYEVKK